MNDEQHGRRRLCHNRGSEMRKERTMNPLLRKRFDLMTSTDTLKICAEALSYLLFPYFKLTVTAGSYCVPWRYGSPPIFFGCLWMTSASCIFPSSFWAYPQQTCNGCPRSRCGTWLRLYVIEVSSYFRSHPFYQKGRVSTVIKPCNLPRLGESPMKTTYDFNLKNSIDLAPTELDIYARCVSRQFSL